AGAGGYWQCIPRKVPFFLLKAMLACAMTGFSPWFSNSRWQNARAKNPRLSSRRSMSIVKAPLSLVSVKIISIHRVKPYYKVVQVTAIRPEKFVAGTWYSALMRKVSRVAQDRLSRCRTGTRRASAATAPRIFRGSYNDETAITSWQTRAVAPDRFPTGADRRRMVAVRVG